MSRLLFHLSWGEAPLPSDRPNFRDLKRCLDLKANDLSIRAWTDSKRPEEMHLTEKWILMLSGMPMPLQSSLSGVNWILQGLQEQKSLPSLLGDLQGGFSLLAIERATGKVYLAVDAVCQHNLYSHEFKENNAANYLIGSHIGDICAWTGQKSIDPMGLVFYLGLKGVPSPHTVVERISKLSSGGGLVLQNGTSQSFQYWDALSAARGEPERSFEAASDLLINRLCQSMPAYADHQTGVFLSGGLDSTLIAALAQRENISLKAYTAGYQPTYRTDETQPAAAIAQGLKIPHQIAYLNADRLRTLLNQQISQLSEPIADPSFWPQLYLAQQIGHDTPIILDGTGADGLLGGSNKFVASRYIRLYQRIPAQLRHHVLTPMLSALPASRRWRITDLIRKAQLLAQGADANPAEQEFFYSRFFSSTQIQNVLRAQWREAVFGSHAQKNDPVYRLLHDTKACALEANLGETSAVGYTTLLCVQPWMELLKLRNIEHASGLTIHKPFLNSDVIALSLSLPDAYKVHGGQGKWIERKAAERVIPGSILPQGKANFSPPVSRWLYQDVRNLVQDSLLSPSPFEPTVVQKMLNHNQRGYRDQQSELWALFMFQLWWDAL